MRTITEIYAAYQIMPQLQEHQLRVTAVAQQIGEAQRPALPDLDNIIQACLLHDMGNILKFDLAYFPQFTADHGLVYWEGVQKSFRKYGANEHEATAAIARELNVSAVTLAYMDAIGFRTILQIAVDVHLGPRICCYADMRVGPFGVLSVAERMADGKERYKDRHGCYTKQDYLADVEAKLQQMEQQIFGSSTLRPEDITDESSAPLIERLKQYQL